MLLLQPTFFLIFLLFTSLISFSTSHVIHISLDLRSLIYRRLPLITLSQLPSKHFTKEDFRICLENWLVHLKEWNDGGLANIKYAKKIAEEFDLTGMTKDTSLALSDPPDNTQPAPWAKGLSFALIQVAEQLNRNKQPITLMPWIFIPDSQAFHFIMVYKDVSWKMDVSGDICIDSKYPEDFKLFQQMVPESDRDLIKKDAAISLGAVYVRHNRDEYPRRKSQVNDLTKYKADGLYGIQAVLMNSLWVRNYVNFEKTVLEQLLAKYRADVMTGVAKADMLDVWLLDMLKNYE